MDYTKSLRLRDRLVNSARLYLKSHPSYYTDDYPNAWCDVITQKTSQEFFHWALYEQMIDGHIACALDKPIYYRKLKELWKLTDQADEYTACDENYEQDLFGPTPQLMYPSEEDMADDICSMIKDELIYALPKLDEEIERGWRTRGRRIRIDK